jgi:DtxR family Mn-dependent transcriptional regulator
MVERLHAKLGYPDRCPHGWPVAPDEERAESRELVSLADLSKGDSGEIVRQAEQDGGLLSWFEAEGLRPGARVEVRDIQPAAGHFNSDIGGDEQFIAYRAARGLSVRRARRTTD